MKVISSASYYMFFTDYILSRRQAKVQAVQAAGTVFFPGARRLPFRLPILCML